MGGGDRQPRLLPRLALLEGAVVALSSVGDAIAARGVERRFGPVRALRGVDLDVARGETLAIFGSNGAGKTTLLRVLAGLLRASAGDVRVLGQPVPGDAPLRRRLGVLAHEPFVYSDLSAAENLFYYARLYGIRSRERVDALLAEVGLRDAAARPARTYSRGMLQRLSLARAVLHEPDLLLLDEPFSGLDATGAEVLGSVLARLRARGATVVLTTHDFDRGLAAATAAVVLHRGRVAWRADGTLPDADAMREVCMRVTAEA
jgi:heme exporter protein A